MPPFVSPSCAGTVAKRLAHLPRGSVVIVDSMPAARSSSRTVSISPRLGLRLTVSKEISRFVHGRDFRSCESEASRCAEAAICDIFLLLRVGVDHSAKFWCWSVWGALGVGGLLRCGASYL